MRRDVERGVERDIRRQSYALLQRAAAPWPDARALAWVQGISHAAL